VTAGYYLVWQWEYYHCKQFLETFYAGEQNAQNHLVIQAFCLQHGGDKSKFM